jgi:PhzF family phenazine biosynthesis protein
MTGHRYAQVDVFTVVPLRGNALAVVFDAAALSDERMQAFARWTNLSETTFLLPPTESQADYRLRIFTPERELPFAGHPTLGSCHAWLEAGGVPRGECVVQECAIGCVQIRREKRDGDTGPPAAERLAFAAPPLRRAGAVEAGTLARIAHGLRIAPQDIVASQWVDNGPGWVAVMLANADAVLALEPDFSALQPFELGVIGAYPPGGECAFEVRAFVPSLGVPEDPVTGSLNAGLAQWLIGAGLAPERYVVSQGTRLGRAGRVHVQRLGESLWIGGDSITCIAGRLAL